MPITLIYTHTDKWLISKDEADRQTWQDKLYWFKACKLFDNVDQCADFLKEEYSLKEEFRQYIIDTIATKDRAFELHTSGDKPVKIIPTQVNLLQSKGTIIDWQDWVYFFTKEHHTYMLWVYLGGIAEQVREIILSDAQVFKWQELGNKYILEMVADIQQRNSQVYADAVNEHRKLL
ncbi:hypothetical protein ACTHGU_08245 [Chitinophagaceae bacterium MMS25-I14]